MAAHLTQHLISGSTSGRGIKVNATSTAGDLIHTAVAGAADFDRIWLEVRNSSAAVVRLTVEWGGATVPDDVTYYDVPAAGEGPYEVEAGRLLNGGLVVRAFAATADVLTISGRVTRSDAA